MTFFRTGRTARQARASARSSRRASGAAKGSAGHRRAHPPNPPRSSVRPRVSPPSGSSASGSFSLSMTRMMGTTVNSGAAGGSFLASGGLGLRTRTRTKAKATSSLARVGASPSAALGTMLQREAVRAQQSRTRTSMAQQFPPIGCLTIGGEGSGSEDIGMNIGAELFGMLLDDDDDDTSSTGRRRRRGARLCPG